MGSCYHFLKRNDEAKKCPPPPPLPSSSVAGGESVCGVRARRCFERAARDDAGDTTPLASLAKLYKEDHEPDKAAATYRRLLEMLEGQVRLATPLLSSAVGVESVWCAGRSRRRRRCAMRAATPFSSSVRLLFLRNCFAQLPLSLLGGGCGSGVPHGARALRRRGAALQGAAGPRRRAGQGARQGPAVRIPAPSSSP